MTWIEDMRARALALALLALLPIVGPAEDMEDLDTIREAVREFVADSLGEYQVAPQIQVGRIDPRLRLARCASDLETFSPTGRLRLGNLTVGVRCTEPSPWTIYVPATAKLYRPVVVATRPLARGQLVTPDDVHLEDRDLNRMVSGFYLDTQRVVGKRMARSLAAGRPLNRLAVAAPKLVRRGQKVTLLAEIQGLTVRMQGTALADASEGELVRVRNQTSKRVVEGVVKREGLVQVRL
jgi:flagella basal body P-ring formation protein FlgA